MQIANMAIMFNCDEDLKWSTRHLQQLLKSDALTPAALQLLLCAARVTSDLPQLLLCAARVTSDLPQLLEESSRLGSVFFTRARGDLIESRLELRDRALLHLRTKHQTKQSAIWDSQTIKTNNNSCVYTDPIIRS